MKLGYVINCVVLHICVTAARVRRKGHGATSRPIQVHEPLPLHS